MDEILTELEKQRIEQFCSDKEMYNAVKKVLLQYVYHQGVISKGQPHNALNNRALVLVEAGEDDAVLGARLRALWEGVQAVEKAFYDLDNITSKKPEAIESPYNEAE